MRDRIISDIIWRSVNPPLSKWKSKVKCTGTTLIMQSRIHARSHITAAVAVFTGFMHTYSTYESLTRNSFRRFLNIFLCFNLETKDNAIQLRTM